jgi:cell division ATPase FtsA
MADAVLTGVETRTSSPIRIKRGADYQSINTDGLYPAGEGAGYAGKLSAGIVLTGGAAELPGVAELAAEVFGTGVRVGVPSENLSGLLEQVEAPRYATAVGLALYASSRVALGAQSQAFGGKKGPISAPNVDKLAQRVKTWLQDFF